MATVIVNLRRRWFAPNGSAYEPEDNPHSFPAAWAEEPKQGENESDEDFEKRKKSQKYAVLPTTAVVVATAETEDDDKKPSAPKAKTK